LVILKRWRFNDAGAATLSNFKGRFESRLFATSPVAKRRGVSQTQSRREIAPDDDGCLAIAAATERLS
jgi:hypothetical protein